ncbi:MAG TPA: response regulator [Pseudomonadota bacterium]|nr:response regulator [Pseudomonadota bacterium]
MTQKSNDRDGARPQPARPASVLAVALVAQSAETIRHFHAMLLGSDGVTLSAWLGYEQLLARLSEAAPAVIVLDASQQQTRGLETLRLLRRESATSTIPILIFCDKAVPTFLGQVLALGAHDYLTQASDAAEVVARLRYHGKRARELKSVRRKASALTVPAQHAVKVLMVDESKLACQVVASAFAAYPELQFTACSEPGRALAIADDLLPTVILQSLVMRDGDAFELVASFRHNLSTRDVPIIVLSGTADPAQKAKALAIGADDYVVKSKDLQELLARVRFHSAGYYDLLKGRLFASAAADDEPDSARVLMVDDSKFACAAIAQLLSSEPLISFTSCTDPTAAIERAREFRPSVLLLDLEMPVLGGLELLQHFREDPSCRDIPVIVLSAISDPATKAKVFAEGANDYAEKQMDKIELISRIHYHSRGYRNSVRLGESVRNLFEIQKRLEIQGEFIRKTFGRYLSDDVVDSLLASPEGLKLGGEKRMITILMADLRGFTSMSERLPPEHVLAIINNYFKVMTGILLSYGATIDEFIGDSILAVFGAPKIQEDDAQRAVACAVEMQLAMQGVNAINHREGYPEVRMGIGIHSGEVVVGNIGSEKRAKYGVVGKNVNLTSRIESYTLGGQILISESTQRACFTILRIDNIIEVMPKGVPHPIRLFEVGGIGGRYQRFMPERTTPIPRKLSTPVSIRFTIIEEKHSGPKSYNAKLIALSEEAAFLLAPEAKLDRLTNLKITVFTLDGSELTTELYGKVTSQKDLPTGAFRVDFTSIPPETAVFFAALRERNSLPVT